MVSKSLFIVLSAVCAQLCFGAPSLLDEDQLFDPTEMLKMLKALQYPIVIANTTNDFIRSIPNIDAQKIEPVINAVNKYIKGPTSQSEAKEGVLELLFMGTGVSKAEQFEIFGSDTDEMTFDNVKEIDEKLHKKLAPEQAETILGIVQNFKTASPDSLTDGTLEMMVNAINKALGKPSDFVTKEKLRTFVDEKESKAAQEGIAL